MEMVNKQEIVETLNQYLRSIAYKDATDAEKNIMCRNTQEILNIIGNIGGVEK